MSKKLLTKLLAVVLSAGLVLQPVAAFAADGELTEPAAVEEAAPVINEEAAPEADKPEVKEETPEETPEIKEEVLETAPEATLKAASEVAPTQDADVRDYAEEHKKTVITNVSMTSNRESVLVYDGEARQVTLSNVSTDVVDLQLGQWFLDGYYYKGDKFVAGTYKYWVAFYLKDEYVDDYEIDPQATITVDGVTYVPEGTHFRQDGSMWALSYYVGDFKVADPNAPKITMVSGANVTSDYEQLPKYGADITNPSFNSPDNEPIVVGGNWSKKDDNDCWIDLFDGKFTSGTYRITADVRIAKGYEEQYELDREFKLNVNGKEWKFISYSADELGTETTITFVSEEFPIEAPEGLEKIKVTNLNINLIGMRNIEYDAPVDYDFNLWCDESPEVQVSFGGYQVLDDGAWIPYEWPTFDEGEYRYLIKAEISPKYADTHELDPDITANLNKTPLYATYKLSDGYDSSKIVQVIFATNKIEVVKPQIEEGKKAIKDAYIKCNYEELAVVGKYTRTPEVEILGDKLVKVEAYWTRSRDEKSWTTCGEKEMFRKGFYYQMNFEVSVADEYAEEYELADNFLLHVNNTAYKSLFPIDDDGIYYISTETVTLAEPGERKIIESVTATSNISDIFVYDHDLVNPEFSSSSDMFYIQVHYMERDEGSGFHRINTSGKVTPGTYTICVRVGFNGDYGVDYALSEDSKLIIDGNEWPFVEAIGSSGTYVMVGGFLSPEITIDNPEINPPIEEEGKWISKYGSEYYVLPDGKRATGMQKIGEETYLFSQNGTLQSNVFYEENGNKYYFDAEGKLVKGWFDKWGSTYYAAEDGAIQTGFVDIGADTYYFDAAGKQSKSIWVIVESKRYYVKADGRLAKSQTINRWGKKYSFDADGVMIAK